MDATLYGKQTGEHVVAVQVATLEAKVGELLDRGARLATIVGEDRGDALAVLFAFWVSAGITTLELRLASDRATYPSLSRYLPAAQWYERELHDLLGIVPEGHPWLERLVLGPDWPEAHHPLRKAFDRTSHIERVEAHWPRVRVRSQGTFQIPYGPVRSGICEASQFAVETGGEDILYLNVHFSYKHRGVEKLFEQLPLDRAVYLAEQVSGADTIAHSTAFCQAAERALGIEVPARARSLRSVCQELERIYNHLDVVTRECEAAALSVGLAQFGMLRERMMRLNLLLSGSRFLRGINCIGGVRRDLSQAAAQQLSQHLSEIRDTFRDLRYELEGTNSFIDRLITTGRLSRDIVRSFGGVGPVARGSGIAIDSRADRPYAGYAGAGLRPITRDDGDAMARILVRLDEIEASFGFIQQAATNLPAGPLICMANGGMPAPGAAFGWAESAKGELVYWLRLKADGRIERCKVRSASFANWPLFAVASAGTVLTDFAFTEHSFGLSVAESDL